jgi:anion-transporting  ArsA/GET3 family ATPase
MFRDNERTEFIIVTIPTVMAMAESERLAVALRKERVPCKHIIVNQMVRQFEVSECACECACLCEIEGHSAVQLLLQCTLPQQR